MRQLKTIGELPYHGKKLALKEHQQRLSSDSSSGSSSIIPKSSIMCVCYLPTKKQIVISSSDR